MHLPDPAHQLAIDQFGAIARFQLLRWRTEGQVEGLVARGVLVPVQRGVYRVHGSGIPAEQAPMAAVLRVRTARVAGPLLMGLYGAEGFSREDPFVVLVRPGRYPRNVDFPVAKDPRRGVHDATWGTALPVVTPTLGCIDLAHPRRAIGDEDLRTAVDSLRWKGLTTTQRLRLSIAEMGDHPGARRLQQMFDDLVLVSESEKERDVGAVVDTITPRPERQAPVCGYRVDFFWRLLRLILEFDGAVHDRPDRRARDAERDRRLADAGHEVIRLRHVDLADPDALRARLVAILRRRARDLGVDVDVR